MEEHVMEANIYIVWKNNMEANIYYTDMTMKQTFKMLTLYKKLYESCYELILTVMYLRVNDCKSCVLHIDCK